MAEHPTARDLSANPGKFSLTGPAPDQKIESGATERDPLFGRFVMDQTMPESYQKSRRVPTAFFNFLPGRPPAMEPASNSGRLTGKTACDILKGRKSGGGRRAAQIENGERAS